VKEVKLLDVDGNVNKIIMATKKFKPHMMYSKSGKALKAGTMKRHLELKARGFNHDKRRLKSKK